METKYIDLKSYLEKELEKDRPGLFIVSSERNIDAGEKTAVIVQQLAGTTTKNSAVIPFQIDVITTDVDGMMDYFTAFVKDHNQTTFTQTLYTGTDENGDEIYSTNTIRQTYNTPAIIEKDIEYLDNHYARIVVFAQMFVLFNASNVERITIDGEDVDFQSGNISYIAELKSNKKSGRELNKATGISSAISLTFLIASQSGIFAKTQSKLRTGKRKRNAPFIVEVELTDGTTETYKMIVQTSVFAFAKNGTPSYQISMMEFDDFAG